MKFSVVLALYLLGSCVACGAAAMADAPEMSTAQKEQIRAIVREVLHEFVASQHIVAAPPGNADTIIAAIRQSNRDFVRSHGPDFFKPWVSGQHPRATVITCSDSRVQTHALDAAPDGDLFMVRDIGNQIATAEGSVEYGVHHLHTPLLLIVGHSDCGAIKAAASDYSRESAAIRRELDSLEVPKGEPGMSSIQLNVNAQVRLAMTKFDNEVRDGGLTVLGAVYDFSNEMKQGQGKLNIINVNGETDLAKIAEMAMMKPLPLKNSASRRARMPRHKKTAAPESEQPKGDQ